MEKGALSFVEKRRPFHTQRTVYILSLSLKKGIYTEAGSFSLTLVLIKWSSNSFLSGPGTDEIS